MDDDPEVHLLSQTLLELDGRFTVVAGAANGVVAVALAHLDPPDAIVLDLAMPGMDGWRALPLLRQACPHAAIVVLSAFPDPLTLAGVLRLGADEYLDKQSSWQELPMVLGTLCGQEARSAGGLASRPRS